MIHQLPLKDSVLEEVLNNIDTPIVVDLENSRLDGRFAVVHLTNITVPFSIATGAPKEKKFQAFETFLKSKFKTRSEQLMHTLIRMLSRYHGCDIGSFEGEFLCVEEMDEFVLQHKEYLDLISEYLASMVNTLLDLDPNTKAMYIDPLVEAGIIQKKQDVGIGVNVRLLVGIDGFIEEYSTWIKEVPNVLFEHTMLSNEHVVSMLIGRSNNSTQGLIYALSNGIFIEGNDSNTTTA
jgi:hypothetical protein